MKNKIIKDDYLKASQMDKKSSRAYFTKSIVKTEQQKYLESILLSLNDIDFNTQYKIADIACGGGTLSYHLSSIFPNAEFYLLDYNIDALDIAKTINKDSKKFIFIEGDLRHLPFDNDYFDFVFCWQTIMSVDKELIGACFAEMNRVLKPKKGRLYASSLFNTEFDVDIESNFRDFTRDSGKSGIWGKYTTYSMITMHELLDKYFNFKIHPFHPKVDFPKTTHRGIGTYSEMIIENNHKVKVEDDFGGAFIKDTYTPISNTDKWGGEEATNIWRNAYELGYIRSNKALESNYINIIRCFYA